jgi:hypothetical protein
VLKRRKKKLLKKLKKLLTATVWANSKPRLKVKLLLLVRSTKLSLAQFAQLLPISTANVPFHVPHFAQPQQLNMQVAPLQLLRLTTNRSQTNSTKLMLSAVGTRALLQTKFTTRLMLELTLSPLREALQSKSNIMNSQATADKVVRRQTHVPTKNREFRWPTMYQLLIPILVFAQLHVLPPAPLFVLQYVLQFAETTNSNHNLKFNSNADDQA